jgi:hypothetical protein
MMQSHPLYEGKGAVRMERDRSRLDPALQAGSCKILQLARRSSRDVVCISRTLHLDDKYASCLCIALSCGNKCALPSRLRTRINAEPAAIFTSILFSSTARRRQATSSVGTNIPAF